MNYLVTARKWRPMVFEDVIGQQHIAQTLRNALESGRLAHAFIFSGGRGCGKTTTARILAKAVNCLNPQNFNPCNACGVCEEINSGRSLDIAEIDGASNTGVDDVRKIKEAVQYTPSRGKKRIYIIDEVHMLSKNAFNALLKTLEEPPAHILFIFATTEINKVPSTIISRCQRYDFRRISTSDIIGRLRFIAEQEKISIDDESLMIVARKGDGSMRDAQSIFDQIISFCGTTVTAGKIISGLNLIEADFFFRISDAVCSNNTRAVLMLTEEIVNGGYDLKEFLSGLSEHFRNFLVAKTAQLPSLIDASEIHRSRYMTGAAAFSEQNLLRLIKLTNDLEYSLRNSVQPRFTVEAGLVQMAKMTQSVQIDELLGQLAELKKKFNSGAPPLKQAPLSAAMSPENISSPAEISPSPAPPRIAPQSNPSPEENSVPMVRNGRNGHYSAFNNPFASLQTTREPSGASNSAPDQLNADPFTVVSEKWNIVVEQMKRERMQLGLAAADCTPLSVENDVLRLACHTEQNHAVLKRSQSIVIQKINAILGTKLSLDLVLLQKEAAGPENAKPDADTAKKNADDHPFVKLLYKEFKAERI